MRAATRFILLCMCLSRESVAQARWVIDSAPILTLGGDGSGDWFNNVVGATRLPDGRILVGDVGDFALLEFAPDGKHLRRLGRKGAGPGEIGYLKNMLRCGDSLVTIDIEPSRVSVFSLQGAFIRSFRFGAPESGPGPYQSACNGNGVFAHMGWENVQQAKGGTFRQNVPFWTSGADSAVRKVLGHFPGSERYGLVVDGKLRGIRPLPLGKQPLVAVGPDRAYIGTAERYEVFAFDLNGRPAATLRRNGVDQRITRADIDHERTNEIAQKGEKWRTSIERDYAAMSFPSTIPAYSAMLVDAAGLLWVRDYPRSSTPGVRWSVFAPQGRLMAEVFLPASFEVYEVGRDYVLGRFIDRDRLEPEVRMYQLRRK